MYVVAGKRGRDGAGGSSGPATTTGAISATSVSATGAISGSTVAATSNSGDPTSHTDTVNVAMHCAGGMSVAGLLWSDRLRTTQHFTVSDARTKDNIEPLPPKSGAALVGALQPVSYVIKSTGDATIGFVAQEVEKLDPRLVCVTPQGDYSLDYRGISVHAVHALQELQRELEQTRDAVRALERKQSVQPHSLTNKSLRT